MTEDIEYVEAHIHEQDKKKEYFELFYSHLHHYISKKELKEDVLYCFEKGRVLAAYNKDRMVGAVCGVRTPFFDSFHVAHLAVEEDFRGKGIGGELMDRIVPTGSNASVHLNVENEETQRFYKHIGYVSTHIRFLKK